MNAHPHRAGRVTLVHNGIIENYEELKDHFGLADELISDTDSEVVAAVLNRFYTGDPHEALFQTVKCLKGTFALVVIFDDIPDVIFAISNVSPIVAAYREDGTMLAWYRFHLPEMSVLQADGTPLDPADYGVTEEAVAPIRQMVGKGDLVFLKASRRTGLEVIEPED